MKIDKSLNLEASVLSGADIFQHGHLPMVAAYCRRLGLVDLVNSMVETKMDLSPGLVVQAMVLDTLSGRSPLYRLEKFMLEKDVELLLGKEIPPAVFNDTNLGRSLDALFTTGTSNILTELGIRATEAFALDTSVPSYDTTSTSVWGDYRVCEAEQPPPGPIVTHGHSKDHLPALKQFMTELLCVERGVPIFGRTLDGNSSDKTTNNQMLTRISSIMAKHGLGPGAFVYVADSAMVTQANLDAVEPNDFITRLPATYNECDRAITEAVDSGSWTEIGKLAETVTGKNRPCADYKTFETSVTLYGKKYRAVVVHSSSHDKRRRKKLEKAIVESSKLLATALKKLPTVYSCMTDAMEAAKRAEELGDKLHSIKVTITPVEVRRRGRPPIGRPASTSIRHELSFTIVQESAGIERQKMLAGCFVLLSNISTTDKKAMDAESLLRTYKGQYGVENNFSFLKDPLVVNDLFLKTPSRIDALGMILVISLMVWRLMERSMRAYVENTGTTLPGWDNRETKKPTSFMMTVTMTGIMVALTKGERVLLCRPGIKQMAFLQALGLGPEAFTNPHYRCTPIIPLKLASKG